MRHRILHLRDRNRVERRPVSEHARAWRRWRPHGGIGRTEKKNTWHAARRGQVTDAGIVAEEQAARGQFRHEGLQRLIDRQFDRGWEWQTAPEVGFRLAEDNADWTW